MDEGKLRRCHEHMVRLAEECGSIRQLLMVFFSFLHRMTDFYVVDASPRKPMGFDPGVAERMVLAALHAFPYKGPDGKPLPPPQAPVPASVKRVGASASTSAATPATTAAAARDAPTPASPASAPGRGAGTPAAATAAVLPAPSLTPTTAPAQPVAASASTAAPAAAAAAPSAAPSSSRTAAPGAAARDLAARAVVVRYTDDPTDRSHGRDEDDADVDGGGTAGDGTKPQLPPHLQIPVGNGGVGPGNAYWWTQTLDDATLFLPLPVDAASGDIVVDVKPTRMTVALRGRAAAGGAAAGLVAADPGPAAVSGGGGGVSTAPAPAAASSASSCALVPIITGTFHAPVRAGRDDDAALWTIDTLAEGCPSLLSRTIDITLPPFAPPPSSDASASSGSSGTDSARGGGATSRERIAAALSAMPPSQRALFTGPCKLLVVTLGKVTPTWWRWVVDGHPAIDATRVDSTLPVTAYDQETQAVIRKIVFDQGRKAAGLPTSDEEKAAAVLKDALAKPDSPFGAPGGPA